MNLNLHEFLAHSTENGPGTRAVIWVQGCTLNCPGCFNPETHDMGIRRLMSVDELAGRILSISDIEGITMSGGEPFLQAEALAELATQMQQQNRGVVVFSGFSYEHVIHANTPAWNALLAVTDLLIAGPYQQDVACNLALRGSSNQTLHFLSERYTKFRDELEREQNSVEILIDDSGQVIVTGFPGDGMFNVLE